MPQINICYVYHKKTLRKDQLRQSISYKKSGHVCITLYFYANGLTLRLGSLETGPPAAWGLWELYRCLCLQTRMG